MPKGKNRGGGRKKQNKGKNQNSPGKKKKGGPGVVGGGAGAQHGNAYPKKTANIHMSEDYQQPEVSHYQHEPVDQNDYDHKFNEEILKNKNNGNKEFQSGHYKKAITFYNKAIEFDETAKEKVLEDDCPQNQEEEEEEEDEEEEEEEEEEDGKERSEEDEDKRKDENVQDSEEDAKTAKKKKKKKKDKSYHHSQIHTVYSNRCAAFTYLEKYEEAMSDANICISLRPEWFKGYVRKGNIYVQQNKLDEAGSVYELGFRTINKNDEKGKDVLKKCKEELDVIKINRLDKSEKVVGGFHRQATLFKRLINWLIQGGAKFPKLYLKFYSPEYRAIHAMESIHKDEDICFIPHDYIMTSDVAKESEIGRKIIDSSVELRSKHSYLACYLLVEKEKGESSRWHVYISILPKEFETIPLFFDEEQRKWLKGSIALRKIDERLESLAMEWESICEAVPELSRFTLNEFTWARLVVITRIFGLVIDDLKTDGLVPMADMLNHKRPRETKWTYSQKKRGFLITSLQSIRKEAEIFDSYGRKCNSRFFVNYGFSLELNADNEALVEFELPRQDPQFAIKARYLGFSLPSNLAAIPEDQVFKKDFQIPRQYKEKKVKEAFSFLRVLHAQGNEFLIISSHDGLRLDDIPPLSIRNETKVLTTLAVAARKSLQKFETTLEEDNDLLKDEVQYPRFSNARNAVLMRRGEKEVLTFFDELMRICIVLFKSKDFKECMAAVRRDPRLRNPESMFAQYVSAVVQPLIQRQ